MILTYLILDTNIWIYLANGLDTLVNKHSTHQHIELFKVLDELVNSGNGKIIVNDIILSEWTRNKAHANILVDKLKNQLKQKEDEYKIKLRKVGPAISQAEQKEHADTVKDLTDKIKIQQQHILAVENFLHTKCINVPIKNEIKIKVFDLSINKQPPFHNSKNNVADAGILLSAADYLSHKVSYDDEQAFFISNNTNEFTDGKDKGRFHPDIRKILPTNNLTYQSHLGTALNLRTSIIKELEEFYKLQRHLESISFECQSHFCAGREDFLRYGYLDSQISFPNKQENVNQIDLFTGEVIKDDPVINCNSGRCNFCGTLHFECVNCGELTCVHEHDELLSCSTCDTQYLIASNGKNKILDVSESNSQNETSI